MQEFETPRKNMLSNPGYLRFFGPESVFEEATRAAKNIAKSVQRELNDVLI